MKDRARRLIVGLVLAHLVLHGLVFVVGGYSSPPSSRILSHFLITLSPAQGALVGMWAALMGKGTARRILVVLIAVSVWRYAGDVFGEWWFFFFWELCLSFGVFLIAGQMGLELTREPGSGPGCPQFSILYLLGWITATAIVLAILRSVPKDWLTISYVSKLLFFALGCCTLVALASIWAALGRRWMTVRVVVLLATIAAGGVVLRQMIGQLSVWGYSTILVFESVWLVGSLLVVRRAGYRLAWHARRASEGKFSSPAVETGILPAAARPRQDA